MIHIAMQNDNRGTAMHKIALEEHFMIPEFVDYWATTFENISPELAGKALGALSDFGERRLASMDSDGIGLALLPLQDPVVAADELTRCIRDLKMGGAMINGATHGVYLDDARYEVFWER